MFFIFCCIGDTKLPVFQLFRAPAGRKVSGKLTPSLRGFFPGQMRIQRLTLMTLRPLAGFATMKGVTS